MTEKLSVRLWEVTQAHAALTDRLWPAIKAQLTAGHRMIVELRPETRSDDQNRKLHATFGEVAQQAEWMGKKLAPEQWKVLFVSGHSVATKQGAEMVPGLEGEFVNIRESTAHMSKARLSSLLEYVMAWCAENDVELSQ
jgi:hypothetical protein